MAYVFRISFVGTKSCFVLLPQEIKNDVEVQAVKVESSTGIIYSSCIFNSKSNCEHVEINGILGAKQGLQHGQEAVLTFIRDIPKCSSVYVEPASTDDWEIIELNAQHLEETILHQIRVVSEGLIFPIWVLGKICIFIKVVRIEPPSKCALLVENTELHIKPLPRSTTRALQFLRHGPKTFNENIPSTMESSVDPSPKLSAKEGFLSKLITSLTNFIPLVHKKTNDEYDDILRNETFYFLEILLCRVLALEKFLGKNPKTFRCWSTEQFCHSRTSDVYVSESFLKSKIKSMKFLSGGSFLAVIKKFQIKGPRGEKNKSSSDHNEHPFVLESAIVRVNLLSDEDFGGKVEAGFRDLILLSRSLRTMLDIDITSRVTLETLKDFKPLMTCPQKIIIKPLFQLHNGLTGEMLELAIRNYFESLLQISPTPIVINGKEIINCFIKITQRIFIIEFVGENSDKTNNKLENKFCFLSSEVLLSISLQTDIKDSFKYSLLKNFYFDNSISDGDINIPTTSISDVNAEPDVIKSITKYMKYCFDCHERGDYHIFRHGGILLSGPKGSGRTTLCKQIQNKLQTQDKAIFVKIVDCNDLYGKTISSLSQIFTDIFDELFARRPSLLILDNLDSISSNYSKEETESSPHAMLHRQVAHLIVQIVTKESLNEGFIQIFSTAESRDKLHNIFFEKLFFTQMYNVSEFKASSDRICFMKKCISDISDKFEDKKLQDCTTSTITSSKLDSCMALDIKTVAKQVVAQVLLKDHRLNEIKITDNDVGIVLENYVPLQLRHSNLSIPPDVNWIDVGALGEAKKVLLETLLWPTKYPQIFKNFPLPWRKGVLLYGAPGTGKTLLASAAANECKLNLICVKGPELLNKFIGASEKAVRETFARARAAKPCIIFFDELDSLSPKRGHDNTGVTDRVVNQLLAELDGVEQLEGVLILAATSRPDLIDPALLRPGRLDQSIFCPMPNEVDRLAILRTLVRTINLSDDVKLETIAQLANDFTGADLKALVYNSLVAATLSDKTGTDSPPIVCQNHLLQALKSTRPSLNHKDKEFYDRIHFTFCGGPQSQNDSLKGIGQKATFA